MLHRTYPPVPAVEPQARRATRSGERRRRRRGDRFSYRGVDGKAVVEGDPCPHRCAGDPAGVERRLDLPDPQRPPAGHRTRCPRAQAVPLPRHAGGRSATPTSSPASATSARRSTACARRSRPISRRPRDPRERGARSGGAVARRDAHPGRQRRVRRDQRQLRPDDAATRSRRCRRRRAHPLLRRQERGRARDDPARPSGRRGAPPVATRSCQPVCDCRWGAGGTIVRADVDRPRQALRAPRQRQGEGAQVPRACRSSTSSSARRCCSPSTPSSGGPRPRPTPWP